MKPRKFKVLDSSGLGFGINFDGMILELNCENAHGIPGYHSFKQPPFDNNGKPCIGIVCLDAKNVEEIYEK